MLTRDKSFYKRYFSLLLFIACQNLLSYSVSLLDNVMLARFSTDALSGASLANQIQFLLQMIVTSVGEGVAVISSQYWGTRRTKPITKLSGIGNTVALCVGIIFFAAAALFPYRIMHLLSDDEVILANAVDYFSVIKYTYPAFCLSTVMLATMRSVENARIGFFTMFGSLIVNLFFNYCLIFGNFGFEAYGIRGAAYATLIARVFELCVAAIYAYGIDKKLSLKVREFFAYDKTLWRDYFMHATPIILSGTSWGIAMFIQTSIIGHMKSGAVAANALAVSLFSVITVFAYGGGSASGVITGKLVGRGCTKEELKPYVNTMQLLFLATGIVTGLVIFLLKDSVIRLYDLDTEEARRYANQFLTVLSITSIGTSYQAPCLTGIVRGGGHTKFVFYNDLIFQWCIVLLFSLLAAYVWKLEPVWVFLMLKSDQVLKCGVAVFEVNSYRWIRVLTQKAEKNEAV